MGTRSCSFGSTYSLRRDLIKKENGVEIMGKVKYLKLLLVFTVALAVLPCIKAEASDKNVNGGSSAITASGEYEYIRVKNNGVLQIKNNSTVTVTNECIVEAGGISIESGSSLVGKENSRLIFKKNANNDGINNTFYCKTCTAESVAESYGCNGWIDGDISFRWGHKGFIWAPDGSNSVAEDPDSEMGWVLENWISFNFYSDSRETAYIAVQPHVGDTYGDVLYAYSNVKYVFSAGLDYKLMMYIPQYIMETDCNICLDGEVDGEDIEYEMSDFTLKTDDENKQYYELNEEISVDSYRNISVNVFWNDDITYAYYCDGHNFSECPEKKATCLETGYEKYYKCSECGGCFKNEDGTGFKLLQDLATPKLEHNIIHVDAKTPSCTECGQKEHYTCTLCKTKYSDEQGQSEIDEINLLVNKLGHSPIKVAAKEATYTQGGSIAYCECSRCKKLFSDESCKKEIKLSDTKTKAIGLTNEGFEIVDKKTKATYVITVAGLGDGTVALSKFTDKKTKAFTIPKTITYNGIKYTVNSVANNVFQGKNKLKKVTIKANLVSIGKNAFKNCKALTAVTIPKSVTTIGASAFEGCKNLKTVTIKTSKLTSKSVGNKAFKGIATYAGITVPSSALNKYQKFIYKKGITKKMKVKGKK